MIRYANIYLAVWARSRWIYEAGISLRQQNGHANKEVCSNGSPFERARRAESFKRRGKYFHPSGKLKMKKLQKVTIIIMTNRCFWKSLHLQYVWLFIAGHTTRNSRGLECISPRSQSSTWISNCGTPCDRNHQRDYVCLFFHSSHNWWSFLLAISCPLLTTSN